MSRINICYIDDKYLVRDKSSSDGSQTKYYMNNNWYKLDYYGGEGESEYLSSMLLSCTNLKENEYVNYDRLIINDVSGCVSPDFRQNSDEEFVTLYRLYQNVHGRDLAAVTSKMDYDDAIAYVINFVRNQTGLDITTYLANTFWLDRIILNTDRHFNNYGIIMYGDGYRVAPIFDNGKSLFTGLDIDMNSTAINDVVRKNYSKSFSPNYDLNYQHLKEFCTIDLNIGRIIELLSKQENTKQKRVLEYQLNKKL